MTAIPAGHTVPWYRVPLPAGQLEALNQRSDLRGLAQSVGYLAVVASTGGLAVWAALGHHWWILAAALIVHGNVSAFMINGVHELVHGTVFRSRWLNTLFVHLFAFIGWINHRMFWASHSEHHLHTMHFPYDQENVFPIRYRFRDFLREATVNPGALRWLVTYHWRVGCGRLVGDWEKHLLEGQPRHAAVAAWSRWILIGHAAIAGVSLAYGLWIIPVVVSLTPLYCKGVFWLLNNAQHVGLVESVPDFRLNCRTIIVNPVFRFLYWHMNWHIEHHMYAAVPCYRLGALHRAIAHELPASPNGLVATWEHIIAVIWRQRQEPGWCFRPELPGEAKAQTVAPAVAAVPAAVAQAGTRRSVWQCSICGFIYDEAVGLPAEGIAAGTRWQDIPADWRCPDCRVAKADFAMVEITRPAVAEGVAPAADPVVVVGSGMAAYALARELRQLDPVQPVTVVTRDGGEVYAKPALSQALVHGRSPDGLATRSAVEMAADLRIEIRTRCAVTAIDRAARSIATDAGPLRYRHLVLALGAEQIRVPLAGDAADRVLSVNDLADYRRFRQQLTPGCAVVIIGGGLIGSEFANDLAATGHRVTVVDLAATPLAALVPPSLGGALRSALESHGVTWRAGTSLTRVDAAGGRLVATCQDGTRLEADVVLSAVGLRSRVQLAQAAGLAVGRGIRVDARLATSDPAISAVGDCAEIDGQVLPFVLPLTCCARALAASLAGTPTPVVFPVMPVVVKTPACPIVVVRPPAGCGPWQVETVSDGLVARAYDGQGVVRGLAIAGAAVSRREALLAEIGREVAAAVA